MPSQIVRSAPSHGGHPDDLVEYQCFHLIIMGVALDVHVSQAHWQQLKNMSAIIAIFSMIPECLQRDLFSGDEEELALTLLDILEPSSASLGSC